MEYVCLAIGIMLGGIVSIVVWYLCDRKANRR
jgi:hypothetical protein